MDTAQWPQEIVVKPMEEILVPNTCSSAIAAATACSSIISNNNTTPPKARPQKDQALNCPRCNSTNTKFCYYNNYSLTQPRYFCKTCRRYWTEGGSLRNIPVGGGSRKNKRSSSSNSSSSSSSSASKKLALHDHHHNLVSSQSISHLSQNPKIHHQGQDLNLGFPPTTHQEFRTLSEFIQLPTIANPKTQIPNSASSAATSTDHASANHHHLSALELLNGLTSSRGLTPFMPMPVADPNVAYSSPSGFPTLQDFKSTLNFSLDGLGNGFDNLQGGVQQQQGTNNNNGRLLFPFEDLKQVNTSADQNNEQTREQQGDSTGYWSGMLGMGGSW